MFCGTVKTLAWFYPRFFNPLSNEMSNATGQAGRTDGRRHFGCLQKAFPANKLPVNTIDGFAQAGYGLPTSIRIKPQKNDVTIQQNNYEKSKNCKISSVILKARQKDFPQC